MAVNKPRVLFTIVLAALLFSLPASADMIEVKNKGFLTGKIVKEDQYTIQFRDGVTGKVETILKSDLLYSDASTPGSGSEGGNLFQKWKLTWQDLSAGTQPGEPRSWLRFFTNKRLSEDFKTVTGKVAETALDFLSANPEQLKANANVVVKEAVQERKIYATQDFLIGGFGMILMFAGALAAVGFGVQMLFLAFEEGFEWGVLYLANIGGYFAPLVGGVFALLLMLPHLFTLYLILSRWSTFRRPIVYQIFCLDAVLLGYCVLKFVA